MDLLHFAGRAALAVWLLGGAGCSFLEKTDAEQCSVDADCTARGATFAGTTCVASICQAKAKPQCTVDADCKALGGSFASDVCVMNACKPDPKWGCIGSVQTLPHGGTTPVTVHLQDLISMMSFSTTGLTVNLCAKLDPPCAKPLSPAPVLDAMGNVSVTVPSDFDGYLDITDASGTYLPSLIFLDLVAIPVAQNANILLVTTGEETGLAFTAKVTIDPNAGLLLVPTVDCTGARTAGVSVSASPAGNQTPFYEINSTLSTTATQTDTAGNGGFVNAVPGNVTITATLGPGGKEMGKVTTIVRAGAITYQLIRPTPIPEPEHPMTEVTPENRAQYQVITTLGQGGMARVLLTLARGPAGVNKLLVVKELKAELKGDPEFFTMFLDEARIAARLNHPNVVQTYEVSSDGEHPLIVMEYLEGQSLSALLARVGRKVMPLDLHMYILSQVAVGLHYAHELKSLDGSLLNLVHRDVSPHNVFVTYDGLVKLVDFGIAKAADSAGLTQAGQFKGKLGYASPEQLGANVEPFDRRADVFSLGVMLWEALVCRRLIAGEADGAIMNRRLRGRDPSVRDLNPDAPEDLVLICERAMAFEPKDRFATTAEFRAALEGWLDSSRRIGAEDLASLVASTFAAEREKIRGLIEARVKELAANGGQASDFAPFSRRALPLSMSSITSPSRAGRSGLDLARPPADPSDATMRASSAPSPLSTAMPAGGERRFGRTLIGVGVAVAVAVSAMQLTRGSSSATATADSAQPGAAASGAAPGAAATVDVSISADPSEARVFLDDMALATNPFHGVLPKSPLARRLRVVAPGYASEERLVTLDRDLHLELSLKAVPAGAATGPAPGLPYRPAGGGAAGKATATAAPTGGPGEALTGPPRKKPRTIDTDY